MPLNPIVKVSRNKNKNKVLTKHLHLSEIYEIESNDWNKTWIGQTRYVISSKVGEQVTVKELNFCWEQNLAFDKVLVIYVIM